LFKWFPRWFLLTWHEGLVSKCSNPHFTPVFSHLYGFFLPRHPFMPTCKPHFFLSVQWILIVRVEENDWWVWPVFKWKEREGALGCMEGERCLYVACWTYVICMILRVEGCIVSVF
jgi:hypothetical protein